MWRCASAAWRRPESPGDGEDAFDEFEFGDVVGEEAEEVGLAEVVEGGGGLAGEEEVFAEDAVVAGVLGGFLFALGGFGACGFLGVFAVGG